MTDYEFTLVEILDDYGNLTQQFLASPPKFQTTTQTTQFSLNPVNVPSGLVAGRTYAWRVRAKARQGITNVAMYKNDGYSDIFTFKYNGTCAKPTGLTLQAKAYDQINVSWAPSVAHTAYRVAYRKYSTTTNWEWVEQTTPNTFFNLTGLEPATEYTVKVGGICGPNLVSFTDSLRAKTLAVNEVAGVNCGTAPTIDIANQALQPSLFINDVIYAGDFPVTLTQVTGSGGTFSGAGWVKVPWMADTKIKVTFNGITVNTDKKLIRGFIETAYDASWKGILDVDGVLEGGMNVGSVRTGLPGAEFEVNFPINNPTDIRVTVNGNAASIVLTGANGQNKTLTVDNLPTTIKDGNGRIFSVDKNGTVKAIGQTVPLAMSQSELNTLATTKGSVSFAEAGVYAFDAYQVIYENDFSWKNKYEKIGNYGVGRKAIAAGKPDILKAIVNLTDNTLKADSIKFVTGKGTRFESKSLGNNQYEINIVGGPEGDAQELYALYPQGNGKYLSLGKVLIVSYLTQKKRLVLVPVNGATINLSSISQKLNEIYNPIAVEWEVVADANFADNTWDQNNDGALDIEDSGLFSALTSEMAALNRAYKNSHTNIESETTYLFVLNRASDPTVAGDMPRGKQFGYLFNSSSNNLGQAAGHEVAHGVFKLKHIFDGSYNFSSNDLSDNLMNYNGGTKLSKYQWDIIHDPGLGGGLFDSDDDSYLQSKGIVLTDAASFVAPNGSIILLPKGSEILPVCDEGSYAGGFLYKFKANDKIYVAELQHNNASTFENWAFNGYKALSGNRAIYPNSGALATRRVYKVNQFITEQLSNSAKVAMTLSVVDLPIALSPYISQPNLKCKSDITVFTNSTVISQIPKVDLVTPCGSTNNSSVALPTTKFGLKYADWLLFQANSKTIAQDFQKGGICVKVVMKDCENNQTTTIYDPKNCGSQDIITITFTYKCATANNGSSQSTNNGIMMLWNLEGPTFNNACVNEYIANGIGRLESQIWYITKPEHERLVIKLGYTVYRSVLGLLNCSTKEEALAARGLNDAEMYLGGVTHELVNLIDVLGMAEGLQDIGTAVTKSVCQTYSEHAIKSLTTIKKLWQHEPLEEKDIFRLFISPEKLIFMNGYATAKSIVIEMEKEYTGNWYKRGRLTVLVVPIIISGGTYLYAKGPQMVARMGFILSRAPIEIGSFGGKIAKALEKTYSVFKESANKYIFKRPDGSTACTITKNGERWGSEYAEFVDTDWNLPGDGKPVMVKKGFFEILSAQQISDLEPLINQAVSKIKQRNIVTTFTDISKQEIALSLLGEGRICQIGDLVELTAREFLKKNMTSSQDIFLNVELLFYDANGNKISGSIREIDALQFNKNTNKIDKGITMKLDELKIPSGIGADKKSLEIMTQIPPNGEGLRAFITEQGLGTLSSSKIAQIERAEIAYGQLSTGGQARISPTQFKSYFLNNNFNTFIVDGFTPSTLGITKQELLEGALEIIRSKLK